MFKYKKQLNKYINNILPLYRIKYKINKFELKSILYHNVSKNNDKYLKNLGPTMSVPPQKFRDHLLELKKKFIFISLNDLKDIFGGKLIEHPMILTFDDGFKGVYKNALPICEELEVPFIAFINTDFIDNNKIFWLVGLSYIFNEVGEDFFCELCKKRGYSQICKNSKKLINWALGNLKAKDINEITNELFKKYSIIPNSLSKELDYFMSNIELEKLSSNKLVDIGNHGPNHFNMLKLKDKELKKDIERSKNILQKYNKNSNMCFSFPFGSRGRDFDSNTCKIIKDLGYIFIFEGGKRNKIFNNPPYYIKRIAIKEQYKANNIMNDLY